MYKQLSPIRDRAIDSEINQVSPFFTMLIIHLQATQPETKAATKPTANDNAGMLPATSSPFTIFITSNNASPKIGGITIKKRELG